MSSINEKDVRSDLLMKDIYFSKIECYQNKDLNKLGNINLNTKYDVKINNISESEKEIIFDVNIENEEGKLKVNLTAIGIFAVTDDLPPDINKDEIFKYNAVAMMFPFIRSEVALITNQPGLRSVMLQPINIYKLWAKNKYNNNSA